MPVFGGHPADQILPGISLSFAGTHRLWQILEILRMVGTAVKLNPGNPLQNTKLLQTQTVKPSYPSSNIFKLPWHFKAYILTYSGSAHWDLELAVEVRQCPLRSGARGWGPAVPTGIWSSRLRSGSAHCDLELVVEVRQCPLRSGARGWGPAVPTGIWSLRLRSAVPHCDLELAVEVRQCPLRSGARSWGPDGQTDGRKDEESEEVWSNRDNPHLARGGKNTSLFSAPWQPWERWERWPLHGSPPPFEGFDHRSAGWRIRSPDQSAGRRPSTYSWPMFWPRGHEGFNEAKKKCGFDIVSIHKKTWLGGVSLGFHQDI